MRILIPSDNRDFVAELVAAYNQAGCEVVTGTFNFDLCSADFDLIHYQWPEELCGWLPPSQSRLEQITKRLHWWEKRCPSIVTAHNLYLQGYEGNEQLKKLYNAFYQQCSWVLHFSHASKNLICGEFAGARHDRHIVTTPWNFDRALAMQRERGSCREGFGFAPEDFVVLLFGALRSWEEIQLVTRAFSSCSVRNKKLLMAGRYNQEDGRFRRKWRQIRWKLWLWRSGAAVEEGFVPDEDLYRYLDTADVVVVPRLRELNSGIPSLAMTFGTVVIVPSHGAFPEHLAGTGNLFYESGNAASLARAIENAAVMDRKRVGAENRRKADQWTWDKIVGACLRTVQKSPVPSA